VDSLQGHARQYNLTELMAALCRITKKARKRPALLRSFVTASELPAFCDLMSITYAHINNVEGLRRSIRRPSLPT
jgi:hypothetical protein